MYRDGGKWEVDLPKTDVANPHLDILVEGMGRINFAQFMIDRKGITERVTLNGMTLMDWQVTLLPMDEQFIKTKKPDPAISMDKEKPCNFFGASFNLVQTGDTYFDLSGYTKGVLYVNGHNLGRFWNIGPQQRLYCPAGYLKKGKNEILVFDLHQLAASPVKGWHTLAD